MVKTNEAVENLANKLRNLEKYEHLNLPPTLYIQLEIINMVKSHVSPQINVTPIRVYFNKHYVSGDDVEVSGYNIAPFIEKMPEFLRIAQAQSGTVKYTFDREALNALDEKIRAFEEVYNSTRDAVGFPDLKEKITLRALNNRGLKPKLLELLDRVVVEHNLATRDLGWLCKSLNIEVKLDTIKRELTKYRNR